MPIKKRTQHRQALVIGEYGTPDGKMIVAMFRATISVRFKDDAWEGLFKTGWEPITPVENRGTAEFLFLDATATGKVSPEYFKSIYIREFEDD